MRRNIAVECIVARHVCGKKNFMGIGSLKLLHPRIAYGDRLELCRAQGIVRAQEFARRRKGINIIPMLRRVVAGGEEIGVAGLKEIVRAVLTAKAWDFIVRHDI